VGFMVFKATFNNISVISLRSVLLVEDIEKCHRPAASHIMLYREHPAWAGFELTTLVTKIENKYCNRIKILTFKNKDYYQGNICETFNVNTLVHKYLMHCYVFCNDKGRQWQSISIFHFKFAIPMGCKF